MASTGLHASIRELAPRYHAASKAERTAMLDHLCAAFGIHRKHAIRLLAHPPPRSDPRPGRPRQYDHGALLPALRAIWKATNLICSKRLAKCLPLWAPYYRDAQGQPLPAELQAQLCALSAATIDRMLAPQRQTAMKLGFATTKPGSLLRKQIPIRTNQWDETRPGFIEADTVAHCGGSMAGMFVFTVGIVDIASGWTEHRAVWGRGERGVLGALQCIEDSVPFRIRGFDCDNGGEFLNHNLVKHFLHRKQPVHFTRSRAYHKNDNAHIEEKNWSKVRQYLGYGRYDDPRAVEMLNDLFTKEWHLLHNYFLPSVKLMEKKRAGARIIKIHDEAKTPAQRLLEHRETRKEMKQRMTTVVANLNPFVLQQAIATKIASIMEHVNFNTP